MSSAGTLTDKITIDFKGSGKDPTELTNLIAQSTTLGNLTASASELNTLAGVTAGTVTASKALVVDSNKDLASLRNLTVTGTITNSGAFNQAPVLIGDVTTYAILAANSGKLHIIPDLTATCTFTLPAGFTGGFYQFVGNGIALDAANWVFDSPAGVFFRGGVTHMDLDAGAGADELVSVFPDGSSHIHLTVTTPSPVTRLMFFWDGTRWVVNGTVHSNTAPAFS